MTADAATCPEGRIFDLVVVGSGAAGLTAALIGLLAGLKVAVIERLDVIGGTSARSSGTVWVPDNHFMHKAGFSGDRQSAGEYLAGDSISPRKVMEAMNEGYRIARLI